MAKYLRQSPNLLNRSKFLRVVLYVLTGVLTFITLLSCTLHFSVYNREMFTSDMVSDKYVKSVTNRLLENNTDLALFYEIDKQYLDEGIDEMWVRESSVEYFGNLYDAITTNTPVQDISYNSEGFQKGITDFSASLASKKEKLTAESCEALVDELTQYVCTNLKPLRINILISALGRVLSNRIIKFLAEIWLYLLITTAGVISLTAFISKSLSTGKVLAGVAWCVATFFFVPTAMFKIFDFPSRLAIGDSIIGDFKDTVMYTIINNMFSMTTIFFIVTTAALAFVLGTQIKSNRREHRHHIH